MIRSSFPVRMVRKKLSLGNEQGLRYGLVGGRCLVFDVWFSLLLTRVPRAPPPGGGGALDPLVDLILVRVLND